MYSEQRAMRVKRIVDKKRMYVFPYLLSLSLSPLSLTHSLSFSLSDSCLSYKIYLSHTFYFSISFRLQPEERKKLLSLKETPSLKDNKDSSRERSPSVIPSVHIEDSTDGNEDGQSDREASPSTIPDSELPAGPNGVDNGAIRGSESANGLGVLAASGDASEGGGGVFGEGGDDLTEEERETVSHVLVIVHYYYQ